jgi:hypothetical protein
MIIQMNELNNISIYDSSSKNYLQKQKKGKNII